MEHKKELEDIVTTVVREGASDLHLTEGRVPYIRSSGELIPLVKKSSLTTTDMQAFLNEFLTPQNKVRFEKDKQVDFSYSLTDARFRGNAYLRQGLIAIA